MTDLKAMLTWLREQAEADLARANQEAENMLLLFHVHEPDPEDHDYLLARSNMRLYRRVKDEAAMAKAVLAILGEHYILSRDDVNPAYDEMSVVPAGTTDRGCGCTVCHYKGFGAVQAYGVCRTVRSLLGAYRLREGYLKEWANDLPG